MNSVRPKKGSRAALQYVRWTFGSMALALTAIAALNFLVDPYWIYRGPLSTYWCPNERQHSSRIVKSEMAIQDPIDVAILGDSRALWGLDPRHPDLTIIGNAYNLAMVGASIHECSRMLDLLINKPQPPKSVIWLMQPEFVVFDRRPQQNFDYRLSRLNPSHVLAQGRIDSLIGNDSTQQSISLLTTRPNPRPQVIVRGYAERTTAGSPIALGSFIHFSEQQKVYISKAGGSSDVAEMESVLSQQFDECARRGIRVDVVIPPSHALYWKLLKDEGWDDRVESGKRSLCKVAAAANGSGPTRLIRIWDFSGFSGPAAEEPPAPSSPRKMVYHSDAVHFTPRLGEMLISRLLGSANADPEFGTELTGRDLDMYLARWDEECGRYSPTGPSAVQVAAEPESEVRR